MVELRKRRKKGRTGLGSKEFFAMDVDLHRETTGGQMLPCWGILWLDAQPWGRAKRMECRIGQLAFCSSPGGRLEDPLNIYVPGSEAFHRDWPLMEIIHTHMWSIWRWNWSLYGVSVEC